MINSRCKFTFAKKLRKKLDLAKRVVAILAIWRFQVEARGWFTEVRLALSWSKDCDDLVSA